MENPDSSRIRYCSQCRSPYGPEERFCPLDGAAIVDADAEDDPKVGMTLGGRYLLKRRIGEGGMGEVYEADHIGLDKRVAVKFLLDKYTTDREVLVRFHREARTASKIGHDNIVDIYDIGDTENGQSYIVMELLGGEDLGELLRRTGRLSVARAVHIIRQICRGLTAAHDKGVVHRDMKPENVFLTQRGDRPDVVKIMDFGISKIIDAHDSRVRLTETGAVVGTPVYMAPEQAMASAHVDHRVDIYAVGVMLYELLCGRPPFTAPTYLALVTQHLNDPPPPPRTHRKEIPVTLEKVIMRALEKEPSRRFATMRDMELALPAVQALTPSMVERPAAGPPQGSLPGGAYPAPTAMPTAVRRRSKTPYLLVGGAAVLAAGFIALGWFSRKNAGDQEARPAATPPTEAANKTPDAAPIVTEPITELATLEIDSNPRGATVYLDDEERGVTPLRLRDLKPGVHLIRLELKRHETLEVQKQVRAGYSETFFGALAPKKGRGRRPRPGRPGPSEPIAPKKPPDEKPHSKPAGEPDEKPPQSAPDRKPNPFVR